MYEVAVHTRGNDVFFFKNKQEALRFVMSAANIGFSYTTLRPEVTSNASIYRGWTNYHTYLVAQELRELDAATEVVDWLVELSQRVPFASGERGADLLSSLAAYLQDWSNLENGYNKLGRLLFFHVWGKWNPSYNVFYSEALINWREIFERFDEIVPAC